MLLIYWLTFRHKPDLALVQGGLWLTLSTIAVGTLSSRLLKLPLPWRILNGLLLPLFALPKIVGLNALQLDSTRLALLVGNYWGWLLLLSLLIFLPALFSRVPYFPTSKKMERALLTELPKDQSFTFIDLGCGFAGTLINLARANSSGRYLGVELSPLCFLIAWCRTALFQTFNPDSAVKIRFGNIFTTPLDQIDFIYCFLSPAPMSALWSRICKVAPEGSIFLVNSFPVEGLQPEKIVEVADGRNAVLFRYKVDRSKCL